MYAHEPIIEQLEADGYGYILVAQPGDHHELFEWVDWLDGLGKGLSGQWQQERLSYRYRIARQVPLTGQQKRWVNFFEDQRGCGGFSPI